VTSPSISVSFSKSRVENREIRISVDKCFVPEQKRGNHLGGDYVEWALKMNSEPGLPPLMFSLYSARKTAAGAEES